LKCQFSWNGFYWSDGFHCSSSISPSNKQGNVVVHAVSCNRFLLIFIPSSDLWQQ
jgi:hypothetical protein